MVIVHLSANQRRIISPEKNETLDQLFKRFCLECGYVESKYEFQSYPEDHRVILDVNINANRVKEVSLVQKIGSRRSSEGSCYTVIHEVSPKLIEKRKNVVAPVHTPVIPSSVFQSPTDITTLIKQPKRSAPKPPVIYQNIDYIDESTIPDIEIPPPPGFMPSEKESRIELLCKSVECETTKEFVTISNRSNTDDSLRQISYSFNNVLEMYNTVDNTEEIEDSKVNFAYYSNKADARTDMVYLNVNDEVNANENVSSTGSSVEDVYENLLENLERNDKSESKYQMLHNSSDEYDDSHYYDTPVNHLINIVLYKSSDPEKKTITKIKEKERASKDIEKCQLSNRNSNEWEYPDSVSVNDIIHTVCPVAEMEKVDTMDINEDTNKDISITNSSTDGVIIGDNEYQSEQNQKYEYSIPILDNSNEESEKINPKTEINVELFPKPKLREKTTQKFTKSESGESLDTRNFKSQQLPVIATVQPNYNNDDNSFVDGHHFPVEITSGEENPKFYWELPKQSKTMQYLSHSLNPIDISENKIMKKNYELEIPKVAPKPVKEVLVIMQERPTEQSDRPTYRSRPLKSLYFTAGKK